MFVSASPRLHDGRRATMSNFGAMLPRPGNASAASPRATPRTARQAPVAQAGNWHGVMEALGATSPRVSARGAPTHVPVKSASVKEHDGYEVFYGLASSSADPRSVKQERDGFDIFFGIKGPKQERKGNTRAAHPAVPLSAPTTGSGGPSAVPKLRLSTASGEATGAAATSGRKQRWNTAPPQALAISAPSIAGPTMAGQDSGGRARGKPIHTGVRSLLDGGREAEDTKVKAPTEVPTFSLATPAPSFAPPVELPESAQLYSMATPTPSFVPPVCA